MYQTVYNKNPATANQTAVSKRTLLPDSVYGSFLLCSNSSAPKESKILVSKFSSTSTCESFETCDDCADSWLVAPEDLIVANSCTSLGKCSGCKTAKELHACNTETSFDFVLPITLKITPKK